MATAALVCGIIGLIGGAIPGVQYVTLLASIAAIILGVKAKKELKAQGQPTGMATAGFVLGIIGVAYIVFVVLIIGVLFAMLAGGLSALV